MTYGLAGSFKVYQDQFQTGIVETLTQNSNAFNEASQGAIQLSTISRRGDFSQEAFFQVLAGMVSRRDTTSTSAVNDQNLTQDEWISVKLNRKIGPVNQSRDSFRKIMMGKTEEEMSFILGQMAGKGMQLDMLNTAVLAARAALAAQASVYRPVAAAGTMKTTALVDGLAAFGDAASQIVCWVMHSKTYYDLVKEQITSNIFGVSNFNVANASPVTLNRPVLVTDSDSLIVSSGSGSTATTDYFTLGLTAGGAIVENTEQEELIVQDVTGNENLAVRMQGEFAYNVGIKGFKWDLTQGANPTNAALGNGANWKAVRQSFKDFAGVVIKSK
ncbi:hypothetical protein WI89_00825 [Burkholderia ubonensis]|uniref:Major capsid protein n=1 Tax=Burkholderia ubonensis TaxID=101571 RepID=A0ABD4EAF5_9BURK|nr:major capsid protein [Burkholderia ubonensis]KVD71797.1 hypothetical protein WI89_00825 [Burkholderia ubonensis]KVN92543.1 hypothetical protein WJ68_33510 [Burkholderia ubonensis]